MLNLANSVVDVSLTVLPAGLNMGNTIVTALEGSCCSSQNLCWVVTAGDGCRQQDDTVSPYCFEWGLNHVSWHAQQDGT